MANTYRAVSARALALHGEDTFEADYSAVEERDHVSGGHLEIVPRDYRVLSRNYLEGKQGEVISLALPVENEAALISGGHIERAEPETKKKG